MINFFTSLLQFKGRQQKQHEAKLNFIYKENLSFVPKRQIQRFIPVYLPNPFKELELT